MNAETRLVSLIGILLVLIGGLLIVVDESSMVSAVDETAVVVVPEESEDIVTETVNPVEPDDLPIGETFSEPTPVEAEPTVEDLVEDEFEYEEIGGEELPEIGVVWFTASWCKHCPKAKTYVVEPLRKSGWKVIEVDVDAYPEDTEDCGINSIPTFIAVKSRKLVLNERYSGTQLGPVLAMFGQKPIRRETKSQNDSISEAIRGYKGQMWGVEGMTVRYHLTHAPHYFSEEQIAGLSEREMLILHSYAHENNCTGATFGATVQPVPMRIRQSSGNCPTGQCPTVRFYGMKRRW